VKKMKESGNLELIKNVIRHPGRTVEVLKDKSMSLSIALLVLNIVVSGVLFLYSKFWIAPDTLLFWGVAPVLGLFFAIFWGLFQGFYYSISRFILKEKENIGLRPISAYFLIAFSLYHLVAAAVIVMTVPIQEYAVASTFWELSQIFLLFWIAALCVQAIQQLRKEETEFRTMLKVFTSLFGAYCIQMLLYLELAKVMVNLVFR